MQMIAPVLVSKSFCSFLELTFLTFVHILIISITTQNHICKQTSKQTHSLKTTTIQSDSHPGLNSRTKRQTGNLAEHKRSYSPSFSPESCLESLWPVSD